MYKYKVSVIMAVYNVEEFLQAAIDSVIAQSIGFENIQLILVDDGSADNSGAICDEYAAKYPENIVVVHKENGGVSSARNTGIEYAEGQFVNFMDADDKIYRSTVQNIYDFFCAHYDETDIVSFRMKFFDGASGDHALNYKYKKGTRIINLNEDWMNPQMSLSSSFVKLETIKNLRFDPKLSFAEDAQIVQKVLSQKCTLGVVSDAIYWYRRRSSGEQSAVQSSEMRKEWYIPYMRYFQRSTIEYYLNKMDYVPRFVQYTLMYDLQWRLKQEQIPEGVLTDVEKFEYFEELRWVLSHIDDAVIDAQKNIFREHKVLAFALKYGDGLKVARSESDKGILIENQNKYRLSSAPIKLEFFTSSDDICRIEGIYLHVPQIASSVTISAQCNGEVYKSELSCNRMTNTGIGLDIQHFLRFSIQIPLSKENINDISFVCETEGMKIPLTNLRFGSFFPVSKEYANGYYNANDRWIITAKKNVVSVEQYSKERDKKLDKALCKELWKRNSVGARNSVLVRLAINLLKRFKKKKLILVSDRVMKAGDNGEAFFRYMRENHPEIDTRFVISKKCFDYKVMKKVGPVLNTDSYAHKLCLLLSDFIVSSSAEVEVYNPFSRYLEPYRNLIVDTKFVFLQHGVIKDDLSQWAGRFNKNITGFITSAKPEYDSIVYGDYEYAEENVWLTGLPRFDRLYHDEQKWITVMPTWRRYLLGHFDKNLDRWTLAQNAERSAYVEFYSALLNNERLLNKAKEYGYRLKFLPHPNFQAHLHLFNPNPDVDFLGREALYRDIYAKSELVITDYSSAIFDFIYLRKPIVYTHFDHEEFFAGEHMYSKGYFDYERDGFGEVEYDLESTVDRIIEYMENGCKLKDMYRDRIDNFFAYSDKNNSQRVYEKIMELDARE